MLPLPFLALTSFLLQKNETGRLARNELSNACRDTISSSLVTFQEVPLTRRLNMEVSSILSRNSETSTCQKYAVMTAEYDTILVHTDHKKENTDAARYTLWRLGAFYLHVTHSHL